MSPIRVLREKFRETSTLAQYHTQLGFALLCGCSESLIRALENGRMPVSLKFAREVCQVVGVPINWLRLRDVPLDDDIPGLMSGRPWTSEDVVIPKKRSDSDWAGPPATWPLAPEWPQPETLPVYPTYPGVPRPPTYPASPVGWTCPRCGRGLSPFTSSCPCVPLPPPIVIC